MQEVLTRASAPASPVGRLPLWDDYKELIKSDVADIKNSGGRPAGTITAALFLKEFVDGIRGCISTLRARRTRRPTSNGSEGPTGRR